MNRIWVWVALVVLCLSSRVAPAWAAVGASGGGGPNTSTDHTINSGGFTIVEGVAFDPTAGPWIKLLRVQPGGGGISSGVAVPMFEQLTNIGNVPWTDWHEEVIGPFSTFGSFAATDFAFERNSVSVSRNGVGLVAGVDYTLEFTLHPVQQPPPMGPDPNQVDQGQHWQSVSLFFNAASSIQPSDVLTIQKRIFESHLNGKVWNPFLVAEVAEYPTVPEPASLLLAAMGLAGAAHRGARPRIVVSRTGTGRRERLPIRALGRG